jgi:hypothetical protein
MRVMSSGRDMQPFNKYFFRSKYKYSKLFYGANVLSKLSMIMKLYEMLQDKLDQLNTDSFSRRCFAMLLVRLY